MKFNKEKFNHEERRPETIQEKEKRLAKEIEKLPADILDRVNMFLVWRGMKPWAKLTYEYKKWGAGDPEPDLTDERKTVHTQDFTRLLGMIGLAAMTGKIKREEPHFETLPDKKETELPGREYRDYYISPELQTAEEAFNKNAENEKFELTEEIKDKIQELNPNLYAELMKKLSV